MHKRILTALGLCLAVLSPDPSAAQGRPGTQIRLGAGVSQFVTEYDNTALGRTFDGSIVFGGGYRKWGLSLEYGEHAISGEEEVVVHGAADIVFDMASATSPIYTELRLGWEAHGWDVIDTRFAFNGIRVGAALGYRKSMTGAVSADIALVTSAFSAMNGWGNDKDIEVAMTPVRAGLRVGLTFYPGASQ